MPLRQIYLRTYEVIIYSSISYLYMSDTWSSIALSNKSLSAFFASGLQAADMIELKYDGLLPDIVLESGLNLCV